MRIGLVSYGCKDSDISFNMSQIERALRDTAGKVDLLCFGETFLQGFNSLCWDYEVDKDIALAKDVLMINPIDIEDQNHGGSSYFHNGKLVDRTAYDEEQIIIVQTNVRCANLMSDTDSTKDRIN